MLTQLHWLGALALVAATAATVLVVLAEAVRRRPLRVVLDRVLLGWAVASLVAGVTGVAVLVAVRPPSDPLHLVYGLVAPAVLFGARFLVHGRYADRRSLVLTVGTLVAAGVVARSFLTGT